VLTAKQAADLAGIGKAGIIKAIKSGRLSARKDHRGQWAIDPAEVLRVYPGSSLVAPQVDASTHPGIHQVHTPVDKGLPGNDQWERERKQLESTIEDLRRRLDESEAERRRVAERLAGLLTHEPGIEPETKQTAGRWRQAWRVLKDGW